MADPITNPNPETDPAQGGSTDPAQGGAGGNGGTGGGERTFTQAEVNEMINKRLARERKNQPSDEEMAAFREYQKTHAPKDDAAKLKDMTHERDTAQTELEIARRENYLLRQGVDPEDVDYYAYKISKSMEEDEDFEDAAKKFLKDHKPRSGGSAPRVELGGRLNGGSGGKGNTTNQTMNDLIRAARG